jgi:UDPglucose 6-dehydrogenase
VVQLKALIVGSGLVGEATGTVLCKKGNDVVFHDVDRKRLELLKEKGLHVVDSVGEAVVDSNVIFVCVPTPTANGNIDLSYVEKATVSIGEALSHTSGYEVVVVRSTVVPSTTRCRVVPLLQKHSGLVPGKDFGVCMNPEFLRENTALEDSLNPSRIVIGELDKRSGDLLKQVYLSFKVPIIRMDLDTAEMVKYASNLFLATKISFFNEIHMICQKLGLDSDMVSRAVSLDPRIGEYGVHGGRPFDGKCLPKDLSAFRGFVRALNINPKLLNAVSLVNEEMASHVSKESSAKK